MTTAEFKNIYGVTFYAVKKQINALYEEKRNAYTFKDTIEEVHRCEGHGIFTPTGELKIGFVKVDNKEAQAEIQKKIDELETMIKPVVETKAKAAKIKRYQKEIEELEKELARKKEWLAKNI